MFADELTQPPAFLCVDGSPGALRVLAPLWDQTPLDHVERALAGLVVLAKPKKRKTLCSLLRFAG
jgi:hypothetical protein